MATAKYVDRRKDVMVGNLPDDFLRVGSSNQGTSQCSNASRPSQTIDHQNFTRYNSVAQITLCIVQAQLARNYSITKMDPYVRVRIGHTVYETHSHVRAGKFPNWNKTIHSYLPQGIKSLHLEVFDERTITPDERIAYADFEIPEEAFEGKFVDTWIPLSGRQGEGKEGSINITVLIRPVPYWPTVMPAAAPLMVIPQTGIAPMPYYMPAQPLGYPIIPQPMHNPQYPYPATQQQPYRPTEEDVKQMQEMFPAYDKEVIMGVLESSGGNKEQATTSLLSLSDK
ncbi:toll-interacting protein B-like isoform X1 [Stegodyphus dumicola]|uniref:toll-interacting protein B-like isoform X1 n=2 Tax=Stegodyphus dumicola TaxID=202533 RepID=UPI0015A78E9D|nr:toll-interacting protein B-like isoform X1 [Stegodyphus dumicola]